MGLWTRKYGHVTLVTMWTRDDGVRFGSFISARDNTWVNLPLSDVILVP